jgi:hypothetical protein
LSLRAAFVVEEVQNGSDNQIDIVRLADEARFRTPSLKLPDSNLSQS